MQVVCSSCGREFEARDAFTTRLVSCPECGKSIIAKRSKGKGRSRPGQKAAAHPQPHQQQPQTPREGGRYDPRGGDAGLDISIKKRIYNTVVRVRNEDLRRRTKQDYDLREKIGEGGLGIIYSARQATVDRNVAVKTLKPELASDPQSRSILMLEAVVTGDLEHPNIVPVYDAGVDEAGLPFYVMKHVKGTQWNRVIKSKSLLENIEILMAVTNAVAFAHSKGIVHRDLKPGNVMLGDFGEVVIMDWGEAIAVLDGAKANQISDKNAVSGTPSYMAPEMALGDVSLIGTRSDVYLLGAILYEIVTGFRPHEGVDVYVVLRQAADNIIWPSDKEGELMDISLKAMATNPNYRYQTVAEFQQAVREYQKHMESISLTDGGDDELDKAVENNGYPAFIKAISHYEDALELWPENKRAREGLATARQAYAECAVRKGDLDIARALFEAGASATPNVLEKMQAAEYGNWVIAYHQDFARRDRSTAGFFFCFSNAMDRELPACPLGVEALYFPPRHGFWMRDIRVPGDVLVELTVRWPEHPDGIEVLINSKHEQPRVNPSHMPPGYACQFAGCLGPINFISRNATEQSPNQSYSAPAHFEPKRIYRLAFQRHQEELSMWVDGECVCARPELLPLAGKGFDEIGVRGWGQDFELLEFTVWRLVLPERVSSLTVGDALLRNGHYEEALDDYMNVARSHEGKHIAEKALAKAYLSASLLHGDTEGIRNSIKTRMIRDHRSSPFLVMLWETDAIAAWERKQWRKVLGLLPEIFSAMPRTRVVLELLAREHSQLPPEQARELLDWVARTENVTSLDISGLGVADISALSFLRLSSLNCKSNKLTSIEPVRGMSLAYFSAAGNQLTSIDALKGMPLDMVDIYSNLVDSLEPLRGANLAALFCQHNEISDLSPLANMKRLSNLSVGFNEVSDLSPLAGLSLSTLDCYGNHIASLAPLRNSGLTGITCSYNRLDSLEPLTGMQFKSVECDGNRISDIGPLKGANISTLSCAFCRIASLEPLRGMMTLRNLRCSGNPIVGVEPLAGLMLVSLNLDGCPVTSLDPLRGMPLVSFSCIDTEISSLEPFVESPPADFMFDGPALDDAYVDDVLAAWKARGGLDSVIWRNLALRAFRKGDGNSLRAMAYEFQGQRLMPIPREMLFQDAKNAAGRAGGHLVTIKSREKDLFVQTLCPVNTMTWIGLDPTSTGDKWVTGEPVAFAAYARPSDRYSLSPKITSCYNTGWLSSLRDNIRAAFIIEWDA